MQRFSKDGRLIFPIHERENKELKHKEHKIRYVIQKAYCPNGCNIMDPEHKIHDVAGLRIKFKRPGVEGEFVISAIEGDFDKIILSGILKDGVKDDLYCPHCNAMFKILVNCDCKPDADMIVIGLTPKLDFNNAITFCNVTGCNTGTFVKSGDVIRHIRLDNSF
ncbi:MAG: hypothetical protein GY853_11235 [PVC group bacterium]|nr:hypothetical protein [PVC group bacterium]